jgi:ERCC4-type nuclease
MTFKQTVRKNIGRLYRGINELKKAYQYRTNLVEYENVELLANPHNNLNRWKNYFSQLLNIISVNDDKQT